VTTPGSSPPAAPRATADAGLVRVLGVWDIVFITVVAVTGLRWITRGARVGAPSMLLWLAAWLTFFVPLAVAVAVLSRRYPEQGGVYAWVTRAFGPFNAVVCGWCLWVNNLFYFPSLLLFAAANAAVVLSSLAPGLADDRTFSAVFVLGFLWFTVVLNIRGFRAGRWLQTLGVVGTWIPVGLLIVGAAVALSLFGSATSFAPAELVPRTDLLGTIALWSTFCFAFSGFEIGAFAGQEVKRPERTLPLGIAIAGAAVTAIYILGTVSVLVAVPADALAERSGLADAVDAVASRVGLPALGLLTALLLCVAAIAGTSSWMAGCARVAYAAGRDGRWPAPLARLHPVHGTPYVSLIVQGAVSSLIFVSSLFLTFGGQTSVQEAYDILVNLTILVYFVPYLYLFVALVRLERAAGRPALQVWGLWLAAVVGFAATAVSMGLVFLPPEGTTNVFNYEANLVLQTAAVIAVGLGLWIWGRGRTAA
jgi:amino acid transporter